MPVDVEIAGADSWTATEITVRPLSDRGRLWFRRRYPSQGGRLKQITLPRDRLPDVLVVLGVADLKWRP